MGKLFCHPKYNLATSGDGLAHLPHSKSPRDLAIQILAGHGLRAIFRHPFPKAFGSAAFPGSPGGAAAACISKCRPKALEKKRP
jgi:hypothetical protein